eukprot:EG_transcript_9434
MPNPALPPAGSSLFVHSPYSFPPSPDWADDPRTPLGTEVPPMDPVARRCGVCPAPLAGASLTQQRPVLSGGAVWGVPPPVAPALPSPKSFPDSALNPLTLACAKGDPVAQSVCPHPKPWKRRRAQRGFAFYVCLRCQHEWRVVTPKALRRREELQAQALGYGTVAAERP